MIVRRNRSPIHVYTLQRVLFSKKGEKIVDRPGGIFSISSVFDLCFRIVAADGGMRNRKNEISVPLR